MNSSRIKNTKDACFLSYVKDRSKINRGHTLRHPLNINLTISNENQDCKIGTVCTGSTSGKGEGEERRLR
jgi:hypothetical protein